MMALLPKKSDVYDIFNSERCDTDSNQIFRINNWCNIRQNERAQYPSSILEYFCNIFGTGAIWLSSDGDIYYRFSLYSKIRTASISKINLLFSNFLGLNFKIIHAVKNSYSIDEEIEKSKNENKLTIYINQLLLVEAEKFNPWINEEFYIDSYDVLVYRNTFQPSKFLQINATPPIQTNKSIILQYIYYLCNYQQEKFNFLINWIANFFKNLKNRSETILVMYGNKSSGIDILFRYILAPLFGEEYSLKITNRTLKLQNKAKTAQEKLLYDLDDISQPIDDSKQAFLQGLFPSKQQFAQVLITTTEPQISYLDSLDNYVVLQVPTNITEMLLPLWIKYPNKTKFTKEELIAAIQGDLENFAIILKQYPAQQIDKKSFKDDKKAIFTSPRDKLKDFVNAIKAKDKAYFQAIENQNDSLYKELLQDFANNRITQPNISKYYNIIYPEEKFDVPRTLMKKLREIDNNMFKAVNIRSHSGGKYFRIDS